MTNEQAPMTNEVSSSVLSIGHWGLLIGHSTLAPLTSRPQRTMILVGNNPTPI